jgi:pimeloyl-ACP methyl ester carboxylesterase/membrane protein DedA with SNARE-associated domain
MKWWLVLVYAALMVVSYVVRSRTLPAATPPDVKLVSVPSIRSDRPAAQKITLAYRDYPAASGPNAPVIVLLHGSPGNHRDFSHLAPLLAREHRVLVPDLPGFGASSHDISDYSIRAHAHYVLELLDQLQIWHAHFVGFSMGGGVVLNIADLAPTRVDSVVMMSALGVQELELLGNYHINHALHVAQLAGLWVLRDATPHMGLFDHLALDHSYAHNFVDSDQRPLRDYLKHYGGPMLIIHGDQDMMVPVEAARETYRLVPQSDFLLIPGENHFYLFGNPRLQADATSAFLARVEHGQARVRAKADPQRIAFAAAPFDAQRSVPPARGPTALVLFGLIALATLVSEDLTCISAGVMVVEGRIGFIFAALACLVGIVLGDVLLFLAGRYLGRAVLGRVPFRWFVRTAELENSSAWFRRRGMWVIIVSRFIPGTRLPTYVAAGLLDTGFLRFSAYFLLAAVVWTPLLVACSMFLGAQVIESALFANQAFVVRLVLSGVLAFVLIRLLVCMLSFRGRRLLLVRWRRLRHWEFWPPWLFYLPVFPYVLYLGLKYRSLTLFTCANPAIDAGGFMGESKSDILQQLGAGSDAQGFLPHTLFIGASSDEAGRLAAARAFMAKQSLSFPVVLKPNAGQRGQGVWIVKSRAELEACLVRTATTDTLLQEYVGGLEYGVFYYRYPDSDRGRILSITRKLFPSVTGDGKSTVEELVLRDERAVCMTRAYAEALGERWWSVPSAGESVRLIEIGTHCRGSVFEDGSEINTEPLAATVDRLAKGFPGFFFGRFDIRTPSLPDFQAGRNFKVVELNGVTSEATSIYDRRNSLLTAYRVLFQQWRLAFEIGEQNRRLGKKPTSLRRLLRLLISQWWKQSERSGEDQRLIDSEADCASQVTP